jgi:co-chaperonin GroES (HSP10)
METQVDTKNWIPVGNYLMLKPAKLNKPNQFQVESLMEDDVFEVLGFGSSFKADGLKSVCDIGDKVLIIEPTEIKSAGTKITIGNEDVWFYPPKTVAAVLKKQSDDKYEIIPVNDFVMLERHSGETMIGNIIIPASAEEKSTHATVSILGNGKSVDNEEYKFELVVGDEVLISKWTNNEIEINNTKYIIAKESEILAKVEA